jgi:hypothetical protein
MRTVALLLLSSVSTFAAIDLAPIHVSAFLPTSSASHVKSIDAAGIAPWSTSGPRRLALTFDRLMTQPGDNELVDQMFADVDKLLAPQG